MQIAWLSFQSKILTSSEKTWFKLCYLTCLLDKEGQSFFFSTSTFCLWVISVTSEEWEGKKFWTRNLVKTVFHYTWGKWGKERLNIFLWAIDIRFKLNYIQVIKRLIAIIFLKLSTVKVWSENDVLVVITVCWTIEYRSVLFSILNMLLVCTLKSNQFKFYNGWSMIINIFLFCFLIWLYIMVWNDIHSIYILVTSRVLLEARQQWSNWLQLPTCINIKKIEVVLEK